MNHENNIKSTIHKFSPWFHNIHLPDGTETAPDHPLGDFPLFKWKTIEPHLPADMTSLNVLDIGCNAGFYSIECAKRGATVTAIDVDEHYLNQAEWIAAQFQLGDKISFHQMQVYDLVKTNWQFEIVFFMGVFYHLRYPLLALDIISEKVSQLMVFQTLSLQTHHETAPVKNFGYSERKIMEKEGWPGMAFIEGRFENDPTNWWVPNRAAIKAIFRTCGFDLIEHPEDETYLFKPDNEAKSVINDWNRSEFLSATGKPWQKTVHKKTQK